MANNWAKGKFPALKHPEKYVGNKVPTYRSSWEWVMMNFCDNNPAVLQWASEPVRIPYRNPLTGKNTTYLPDFLMVYIDKDGKQHAEIVEIKPTSQTGAIMESGKKVSVRDRAVVAINEAKWAAARAWCRAHNMTFRVITEKEIL